MQKRNVLNSPRLLELKRRRRKDFWNKIFIFLFGFLVFFFLLVYISRLGSLNINKIQVTGNSVLDTQIITNVVQNEITGKYFWVFPKTNVLFYPKNKIKNDLQNEFPRIKTIALTVKDNKVLEVGITERDAKYTWCGATLNNLVVEAPSQLGASTTKSQESCYFLDDDGFIFDQAPYFSGGVYFKFYGSFDGDSSNPIGLYYDQQNFAQLVSFKNILVSMGLKPFALSLAGNGDAIIYLSAQTAAATYPEIIFNVNDGLETVAENLETALTTEPLQSEFENKYSKLEYIDLRFGNKVYDKFSS